MLKQLYLLNIIILVPVCLALLQGRGPAVLFEGKYTFSRNTLALITAWFLLILAASILGLWWPLAMQPALYAQVIYMALWLLCISAPHLAQHGKSSVPWGITATFVLIVVLWPLLLRA